MTRARCSLLAAVALSLSLGLSAHGSEGRNRGGVPPDFEPDLSVEGGSIDGETWTREGQDFAIHVTRIDAATRLAYIERFGGLASDPFAMRRPDHPDGYLTFLVEIENRGESPLPFNALQCWLQTNRDDIGHPLAISDLSFAYRVLGLDFPAAFERVGPLLLADSRTIHPGRSMHGLLVYRMVHPKTKRFTLDVPLALPDGEVERLRASYRRPKPVKSSRNSKRKKSGNP